MVSNLSKSLFFVLFTLFSIMLPTSSVNAGCAINVSADPTNNINSKDSGQSFTATCDGLLHSITVNTGNRTVTGVTLLIYNGQSVAEENQIYEQSNVTLSNPVTIVLSGSVNLVSEQQYTFRFTGGSENHYLQSNCYNPYDGGQDCVGGTFFPGYDMLFNVEISTPPIASTAEASSVTLTGATLNGTVNAADYSTAVSFEYGTDTGYGTTVVADQSPVSGSTDTSVSKAITGLSQGTIYHYRVVAESDEGTAYGDDVTFTTLGPTQVALTGPVTVLKDGLLGPLTLTALDATDQPANVDQDTVFNLSSSTSGTATFYGDSTATTSITQATIANGESSVTFYSMDNTFGTPTITASRYSGMTLGEAEKLIRVSGNNALSFDGNDDYVATESAPELNMSGSSFTVELWVKSALDLIFTSEIIWVEYAGAWTSGNYLLGADNDHDIIFTFDGASAHFHVDVDWTDGQWHHVAAVLDTSNNKKIIYVDGVSKGEIVEENTPGNVDHPLYIGARTGGSQSSPVTMDEVRIWNTARTQLEIRANMHRELQGNESGLAGYYKLDTGTGTTAYDSSGSGNNGTLTNGPAWQTSGAMSGPGNALDFDGADGYVACPTINLSGSAVTFEAWIRPEGFQSSDPYISGIMGEENGSDIALLRLGDSFLDNNKPQFVLYIGGQQKLDGNTGLIANVWYHMAATYDGSNMRIYINGKEDASKGKTGSFTANTSFWISQNGRVFNGQMDEVRVWNVARTAQEIRDNMCKSLQGDEPGLAAYYRMDQQSVAEQDTLYDQTSNGHDGTLILMDPENDWVPSTAFNTWIGWESTSWSTLTNWSRSATPGSTDNVGIPDYSNTTGYPAGNAPAISGTPTVNHFVLASDAGATLSSGLTVNGNLILESNLDLNGQTITLGSDGYLIEDAGRLYGTTGTITTTRTLSNISSENVAGLGAQLTTAANMGSTVITRGHSAVSEGVSGLQKSIYRYYQITPDPNTGLNATLKFYYNENELNSIPEADLALFRYDSGESKWQCNAANQDRDAANNWVQQTGIDVFSKWTLGDEDDPTLVDLVSFTARGFEDFVRFEWETASEIDNAGFHLWRSQTKGGAYTKITEMLIPAEGGPTFGVEYEYADFDVALGKTWYYKLEDISNTGVSTFHGPVMAVVGDAAVKVVDGPTTLGEGDTAQGMGEIIIEGTGKHTVTTGRYANNPAGAPTFTPTGDYWFVDVTDLSGLNSVTTRFCPADSNNTVYYWNGGGWVKCSQQEYTDGCIAVMITDTTSPRISDLTNLVFAMGRQSAAIPTLSEWGMIVLSLILGTVAVLALRRRRLVIGHWS